MRFQYHSDYSPLPHLHLLLLRCGGWADKAVRVHTQVGGQETWRQVEVQTLINDVKCVHCHATRFTATRGSKYSTEATACLPAYLAASGLLIGMHKYK